MKNKQTILKIKQYVGEIDILEYLVPQPEITLLVAPTGAGKTTALMKLAEQNDFNLAFVSPFTSINEQVQQSFPQFKIETGTKAQEYVSFGKHTITTFHSIVRLLELDNIDVLVIDELHSIISYSQYASSILNPFWDTIQKLRVKHPHLKIVASTGTPQFVRLYPEFNFNEIIVKPEVMLGDKIETISVSGSQKNEYSKGSYICLYGSRKQGAQQALKYSGDFVESNNKEFNKAYQSIITEGRLLKPRLFTSTLLATGVSILDEVDKAIVAWSDIVDCVQFISRLRNGCPRVCVTSGTFWHEKNGVPFKPLKWTGDFCKDMKQLAQFQQWFSYTVRTHPEDIVYENILRLMLTSPEADIIEELAKY